MGILKKKQADGTVAVEPAPSKKRLRKIIAAVIVLVLLGGGLLAFGGSGKSQERQAAEYTTETVTRQDITTELSYSGTLEPADSYIVTGLVAGEILTADFEEGDTVKKDDVLYTIDSSDAGNSLERAENAVAQAQRSYDQLLDSLDDLSIRANTAGQVVDLAVEVGDEVTMGQTIATLRDSATMTIELPFPADEAALFTIGQSAQVTVDGSFETVYGTVTSISASDTVLSGNRIVRNVEISVSNPGAITNTSTATATVGTSACAQSGTFAYAAEKTVTAKASGEVASLSVQEGDMVSKDQVLVVLSSDSLDDQIQNAADQVEDAKLSLDSQQDSLDNYTISSPIDGTIVDKTYKQGDNAEAGKQLCTIFDLSYLTFTMNIDELDISQVAVGQKVRITADAVEGQTFEGTVTKVSINGTTSGGVTAYPVTVRIDNTDGLLPGMNVDGAIVVSEKQDVLAVPVEAVERGNQILVQTGETTSGDKAVGENGIPTGFEYVEVTLGETNGEYIEITDGLSDGDVIAYVQPTFEASSLMDEMYGPMGTETMVVEAEPMPAGGGGPGGGGGGMPAGGGGGF